MRFLLIALIGAGALACSNAPEATASAVAEKTNSAAPASHAPSGVKAGPHEDWCDEHGVPESQCTRCNPKLIPAFKATKDWCEEHSMPESQCTKCNPDIKIVRPPKGS
jgi:hypothetical protein